MVDDQSAQDLPQTVSLLDKFREAIMHGDLMPGERLVEADLAERFDASRGAVREALVLLESERLVARQRNRGAWVRPVSLEEAIEITEVRAVVEALCAGKAATLATSAERNELRKLGQAMSDAVKSADVLQYSSLSEQVHLRIREIAAQQTAASVLDRLRYQSVRYQFSVSLLPGRPAVGLKEHLAVVKAVTSKSPDQAEQAMREHLISVVDALHQLGERPALLRQTPRSLQFSPD